MGPIAMPGKPASKMVSAKPVTRPQHPPPAKGAVPSKHPAKRTGRGGRVAVLLLACAVLGAGLWYWLKGGAPALDAGAQLQLQMQNAANGQIAPTHVFGGALVVQRGEGRIKVTAENVPSKACVQVGWRLAREGTIIVNGTLPLRLSAARLSELCSGDGATLTWVPDE